MLDLLKHDTLLAIAVAAAFSAGLNVYATVTTLGLLAQAGVVQLPPSLHLVESWPIIAVSLALFVAEFFADKVPGFDLLWNALQTFVRVPVAALLAYGATSNFSPGAQIAVAVMGAGIALVAHGGKTAVRATVTPSPEPLSNTALSLGEDVVAVGLTWFATAHPWIAASATIALIVATIIVIRKVLRAMRRVFDGARRQWHALVATRSSPPSPTR
ncbi:MAG TPA: DUF4126 domain-containing protein [Terriglobales bacterium]|nr:DUF4126 domain-containing protein [Terriglobales bacterium]